MNKLSILLSCIKSIFSQPAPLSTIVELIKRWKTGGIIGVKVALLQIREGKSLTSNKILWLHYQAHLTSQLKPALIKQIKTMDYKPLISVLIPSYNTPPQLLSKAIESIQNQWYDNWELCICDDASTNKQTLKVLQDKSNTDSRINVHFSSHNRNISAATNQALAIATGEYVVFLDHDDLLQPQALFRISQAIIQHQPDFIYSDEARITRDDNDILDFFFRPQFSLEMLRNTPYIVHLICFRRQFLKRLGGLNETLKISQDYELILRTAEQTQKIIHLPEVLYLWRTFRTSTGHKMQSKVMETSTQILKQHLQRCNKEGVVTAGQFFNFFDIHYPLQENLSVAIIIPTKNCADLVRQCIDSFQKTLQKVDYKIILVDHASDEKESIEYFETLKNKHIVINYQGEFNFSAINNYAVTQLAKKTSKTFSHFLFCNNDIEAIEDGWLDKMLELGQQEDFAVVGPKLLYPDKKQIQHAGVGVGIFTAAEHYAKFLNNTLPSGQINPGPGNILLCNREVSAVTAACLLIQSKVFDQLKGFNEQLAVGFGDVDLCLRVRPLGKRVIFTPKVTLLHYESYSRGLHNEHKEDTERFKQRWNSYMEQGDPYYNPNLSKQSYCWDVNSPLPISITTMMRPHNKPLTMNKDNHLA